MQFRIGDRDPVTGLYGVIYPDGSSTLNGIKIFNAAHQIGDIVLATQRSDGMMILDSAKAFEPSTTATAETGLNGFGDKPVGYLNGQVFNNEEDAILPTVSIVFAPGSLTELQPGAGNFVIRIKVDRSQRRDLRIKCELTGSAGIGDYTISGLDNDSIATIPAGSLFFDLIITPIQNQSGTNEAIVIKVVLLERYKISQDNTVTAIILVPIPTVSLNFAPGSPTELAPFLGSFVLRVSINLVQANDLSVTLNLIGTASPNDYTSNLINNTLTIVAGTLFQDLIITPVANSLNTNETIRAEIAINSAYTIGVPSSVVATILVPVVYPRLIIKSVDNNIAAVPYNATSYNQNVYKEWRASGLSSPTFYFSNSTRDSILIQSLSAPNNAGTSVGSGIVSTNGIIANGFSNFVATYQNNSTNPQFIMRRAQSNNPRYRNFVDLIDINLALFKQVAYDILNYRYLIYGNCPVFYNQFNGGNIVTPLATYGTRSAQTSNTINPTNTGAGSLFQFAVTLPFSASEFTSPYVTQPKSPLGYVNNRWLRRDEVGYTTGTVFSREIHGSFVEIDLLNPTTPKFLELELNSLPDYAPNSPTFLNYRTIDYRPTTIVTQ